jgi:hypothetical protein
VLRTPNTPPCIPNHTDDQRTIITSIAQRKFEPGF